MNVNLLKYLSNLTILYAEDEERVRNNVYEYLELLFKEIIIAQNGEEAFDLYFEKRPDIILTDVDMPKMNGIEFIKKVRQNDKRTPAVILSAHTDTDYLLSAVELAVTKYIIKPFEGENFMKALESIFEASDREIELIPKVIYSFLNHTLSTDAKITTLTKKEAKLFELLLNHPKKLVGYEQIENEVWCDFDDVMTSENLRTLVKALRKKLPDDLIKNVSGSGYILDV